jgi:hypothetical protein
MLKFLNFLQEEETKNPVVLSFARMNPGPTIGHEKLINKVQELADKQNAPHEIILSHSQDAKKNPLSIDQKLEHARKFFPQTNFVAASKQAPTIIPHLSRLNAAGHDQATIVVGSDRVPQFQELVNNYNGIPDKSGNILYHFKHGVKVVSSGDRDPDAEGAEGMSASKMREHAVNNDFNSFKQGIPAHVPEEHARRLFNDTRSGMNLSEENFASSGAIRGMGYVTGDPGGSLQTYATLNASDADTHDQILNKTKANFHEKLHTNIPEVKKHSLVSAITNIIKGKR